MLQAAPAPDALLQAVSDRSRLRLLRLLAREEMIVQDLVKILGLSQPAVSKHLGILRKAGWIRQRREGTWSWHELAPAADFPGGGELRAAVLAQADRVDEAAADDAAAARVAVERDRGAGDFFAGIAESWDQIRVAFEHPDIQAGAVGALVPPGLSVVDIGTGTGALLPLLAATGTRVTAVDRSAAMLGRARELCVRQKLEAVEFRQADILDLPFADGAFDAAYASMVLHHVEKPARAVAEMARVVKPGGRVIVMSFTRHDLAWMRDDLAHRWLGFERDDVEGFFAAAGLTPRLYLERGLAELAAARAGLPAGMNRRSVVWPDVFLAVGTG